MLLVQVIVGGLLLGAIYALFSSGLTLIWGMMNFINFAHGEFYMLGALLTFYAGKLAGLDYVTTTVAATLIVAVLGMLANRLFFWPLRREHEFTILLASLGLSLFIVNGAELLFGADPKYVDSPFADETLEVGQIVVTQQRVLIFAVAVVVSFGGAGVASAVTFFATATPVCMAMNVPITLLPLLLPVEPLTDFSRTLGNTVADVGVAVFA